MLVLYCISRVANSPTKWNSGLWNRKSGKAEEKKEEETDALVQKSNRNNTKSKDQILLTVKVYHDTEDDLC